MIDFNHFTQHLQVSIDRLGNPPRPAGLLHHYTNAAGFLGIIETQSLWASHYSHMNDGSEIEYGFALLREVMTAFSKEKQDDQLTERLVQLEKTLASNVLNNPPFLFCMCEQEDLISQWREYSRDTTSYSIGFNALEFVSGRFSPSPVLARVEYDRATQIAIATKFVHACYDYSKQQEAQLNSEEAVQDFLFQISAHAWMLICNFKHPAFASEREWRLVLDFNRPGPKARYRATKMGVSPYRAISSLGSGTGHGRLPIEAVWIGPSPYALAARYATDQFMCANGYKGGQLYSSNIPIRSL